MIPFDDEITVWQDNCLWFGGGYILVNSGYLDLQFEDESISPIGDSNNFRNYFLDFFSHNFLDFNNFLDQKLSQEHHFV